uniref:Uncharacterized protein n=1 Tax=Oryza sativa subsp. japonica TaxID=39947 RepID=Q6YVR1_ORYSJ|nr:hypothetical protein [Oryza sativa Japonica Group]
MNEGEEGKGTYSDAAIVMCTVSGSAGDGGDALSAAAAAAEDGEEERRRWLARTRPPRRAATRRSRGRDDDDGEGRGRGGAMRKRRRRNWGCGSVKIDFASSLYAAKADIAATAAALSHALGPPCYQLPLAKVNSSLPLWPPVTCPSTFAQKRRMSLPSPPPAKKLQVQQSSSILPQDFPKLEVLPVEKPTKLQERRSPQHVSPELKQGSPKMERPLLPRPATFIDVMLSSQKPSSDMWSETKDVTLTRKTNCSCKYSKCLKL